MDVERRSPAPRPTLDAALERADGRVELALAEMDERQTRDARPRLWRCSSRLGDADAPRLARPSPRRTRRARREHEPSRSPRDHRREARPAEGLADAGRLQGLRRFGEQLDRPARSRPASVAAPSSVVCAAIRSRLSPRVRSAIASARWSAVAERAVRARPTRAMSWPRYAETQPQPALVAQRLGEGLGLAQVLEHPRELAERAERRGARGGGRSPARASRGVSGRCVERASAPARSTRRPPGSAERATALAPACRQVARRPSPTARPGGRGGPAARRARPGGRRRAARSPRRSARGARAGAPGAGSP